MRAGALRALSCALWLGLAAAAAGPGPGAGPAAAQSVQGQAGPRSTEPPPDETGQEAPGQGAPGQGAGGQGAAPGGGTAEPVTGQPAPRQPVQGQAAPRTEPLIGPELPAEAGAAATGTVAALRPGEIDYAAWQRTATRTAAISEIGRGSTFALERLRADIVGWRDRFAAAQGMNASRIATVTAQLAALGPAPEGDEDPRVTERRAVLAAELERLRAPGLLAAEGYAQADGLIGEIDALIRARKAEAMLTRGPSPLLPAAWAEGGASLVQLFGNLWAELRIAATSTARHAAFRPVAATVLLTLLAGLVLLLRSERWAGLMALRARQRNTRGAPVWCFLFSVGGVLAALAGVVLIVRAAELSGLLGFRTGLVAAQLPLAAAYVLLGRWLAEQLFHAEPGGWLDEAGAARGARDVRRLGWLLALGALALAVLGAGETAPVATALVMVPVQIALSVLLWRLGRLMLAARDRRAADPAEELRLRDRALAILGRLALVIAVAGPALSLAGFAAAGEALTYPAIRTLALIGGLVLLQRFVDDAYAYVTRQAPGTEALLPVLIGFALALLALPVLVLIWGARTEDLAEIWTRFQEGYALGETRISPVDLLTVLVVFAVGYMATRLLQGTLRTAVLPKTRLDIGGQNAIVSGVGYVGVFLSALLAITTAGLDLSSLAIVAGALSVGIGFGLQNIVQNFVSGIILLIERPISEGDWIEVGGRMGYVRDISVRSTRIETFDRTDVIIPNADLVSGQVVNWTRGNAVGRVIVTVSVMFGTDTDRVLAILREVAEAHPMVLLSPPPMVVLAGFGPDQLNFEIRAIVRDVNFGLSIRSEMNLAIARRFYEEGIEFAGGARPNGAPGRHARSPEPPPPAPPIVQIFGEAPAGLRPPDPAPSEG